MASDPQRDEQYGAFDVLSPFSVVPYTHEVIAKYEYETELPAIDKVKRVNSKNILYPVNL
ncbi:hypothetical protein ACFTAO_23500 [Paenibacillus rhizoplanae]